MIKYILLIVFSLSSIFSIAQDNVNQIVPNRYIVQIDKKFNIRKAASQKSNRIKLVRPIFKELDYWLVEFDDSKSIDSQIKNSFLSQKGIVNFQNDLYTSPRVLPNDPMIVDQWPIDLIEVDKVWDRTTGGQTYDGKEIVVGVIDDGFDIDHADLAENQWINSQEIEDNGIDDDGNGYVDDYYGLHVPSQSDNHLEINHGVSVAGIIGAVGNNSIGITGMNWNVKMMMVSITRSQGNSGGSVSDIIEGYQYILDQERRGEVTEITLPGSPLGTLGKDYAHRSVRLEREDVLVWLSDGLIEATCPDGEVFGYERVVEALRGLPSDPERVKQTLLDTVAEHCGRGDRQPMVDDDLTLVVARYEPEIDVTEREET